MSWKARPSGPPTDEGRARTTIPRCRNGHPRCTGTTPYRQLFVRLPSDCRSRSAIGSGDTGASASAGDREDGYLAFVTRYLGPQRQCATSLNTAASGG